MDVDTFKKTLTEHSPPASFTPYLKALWYDANGDWQTSHEIVQDIEDTDAAWIHAYLHRKEGDTGNADYWYRRAGKIRRNISLDQEWEDLVIAFQ